MKPIATKNIDGLLERLEKKSDVRWGTGRRPTEITPSNDLYLHFHKAWSEGESGALMWGRFNRHEGFELVTDDEFVEMIAGWLPKEKKPTFGDVCRPVAEWIRYNAPGMSARIDETHAELYPKPIKRVEF